MNTIPESTSKKVIPTSLRDRMSVLVKGEFRVKLVEQEL